jgi:hypothetical protein
MTAFVEQDAWVLLAVKYAAGDSDHALLSDVRKAGDFINHAPFLERELAHAIDVLTRADLLHVEGDTFRLGRAFSILWDASGAARHRSVHKQLERLQHALVALPDLFEPGHE